MDPLSIATSAVTLVEATGAITSTLYRFINGMKTADARINNLRDELTTLTGFLQAVDRTLKGCRTFDLTLVDEDLWHQSDMALLNCQVTLDDLGSLVDKIKTTAGTKGFGWRARATIDLNIHGAELAAFQDKVQKSNCALQTMLHTITVSLSLRHNASQGMILSELERLQTSIDEALRISMRPGAGRAGGGAHRINRLSDLRVARNLRDLANAAKHFHSAASSTASTIRGGSHHSEAAWHASPEAFSIAGELSPSKLARVEKFVRENHHLQQQSSQPPERASSPRSALSCAPSQSRPRSMSISMPLQTASNLDQRLVSAREEEFIDDENDEDIEHDMEQEFISGLRVLAMESIFTHDYTKAIDLLAESTSRAEALDRKRGARPPTDGATSHNLEIQLALCYLLRGEWQKAEPVVTNLAAKKEGRRSMVVCNLQHALAISHLVQYSFTKASDTCTKALYGKKKLRLIESYGSWYNEYNETVGLLATIFDVQGEYVRAEIFRRQLSPEYNYNHPTNVADFIFRHPTLLPAAFGSYAPQRPAVFYRHPTEPAPVRSAGDHCHIAASPIQAQLTGRQPYPMNQHCSPLQTKFGQHLLYEKDTSKEVALPPLAIPGDATSVNTRLEPSSESDSDADDELSPIAPPSPSYPQTSSHTGFLFSRLFRIRDVQSSGKPDSPAFTPVASSPLRSAGQWFLGRRNRAPKRSHALLRKRSNKLMPEPQSVEFNTTQDRSSRLAVCVQEQSHNSSASPTRGGGIQESDRYAQEDHAPAITERMALTIIAELADTGVRRPDDSSRNTASQVGNRYSGCDEVRPAGRARRIKRPPEKRTELDTTLGELAGILATMTSIKDVDELHLRGLDLEIVARKVATMSNDPVLLGDVTAIIESLRNQETNRQINERKDTYDSGYETGQASDESPTAMATPSDHTVSPLSTSTSTSTPGTYDKSQVYDQEQEEEQEEDRPPLRRQFSWASGSESGFTAVKREDQARQHKISTKLRLGEPEIQRPSKPKSRRKRKPQKDTSVDLEQSREPGTNRYSAK